VIPLGHDSPAQRPQKPVGRDGQASIASAPFSLMGPVTLPPVHEPPIQENANGLVPCERSLEMLVEIPAIACDDDELLDRFRRSGVTFRRRLATDRVPRTTRRRGLLQETRDRCPRRAPARRARLGAYFKALVAIQT